MSKSFKLALEPNMAVVDSNMCRGSGAGWSGYHAVVIPLDAGI